MITTMNIGKEITTIISRHMNMGMITTMNIATITAKNTITIIYNCITMVMMIAMKWSRCCIKLGTQKQL